MAPITHFIYNVYKQMLQHYMLGKNPSSAQSAIVLAQKKMQNLALLVYTVLIQVMELATLIISNIINQNNMGPFHACSGPHLVRDCNESICNRCRPNLDSHTPAKCIRKRPLNSQKHSNPSYNNNSIRSQSSGHNDPNVQLSVSISKLDHIAELLEATKKVTKYLKRSYKHNKKHHNNTGSLHPSTNHYNITHSDKHKYKSCSTSDQGNEIIGQTHASKTLNQNLKTLKTPMTATVWISQADEIIDVKLSNMTYAANFHVTINNNNAIFLFDTGATISCMSKVTTTFTLLLPKKFQQQFIVCKHLLCPIILGLNFSHNYLIGINYFSTNLLHLH